MNKAVKMRNGGTARARKGRTMSREATRASVEEKKEKKKPRREEGLREACVALIKYCNHKL